MKVCQHWHDDVNKPHSFRWKFVNIDMMMSTSPTLSDESLSTLTWWCQQAPLFQMKVCQHWHDDVNKPHSFRWKFVNIDMMMSTSPNLLDESLSTLTWWRQQAPSFQMKVCQHWHDDVNKPHPFRWKFVNIDMMTSTSPTLSDESLSTLTWWCQQAPIF